MYLRCQCEHLAIDHTTAGCFWCHCSKTSKEVVMDFEKPSKEKSQVPLDKK